MNPELEKEIDAILVEGSIPADMAGNGVAFDGSSVIDQLAPWQPPIRSADAEILPEKQRLDARTRDTLRNDGYVANGSKVLKDSIVGSQYLLNALPKTKVLFGSDDDVWETEFQEEVETKFHLAANSDNKWLDASRKLSLTEMVRLGIGSFVSSGEVLMSAEWVRQIRRPFNTAVRMIDPDRLDTPMQLRSNKNIRNGVELDRWGAPIAYHIRNAHPRDWLYARMTDINSFRRVEAYKPWGRPMILHILEQLRPDQSRGIASMVTALTEMHMTKAFRKSELQRAVVAATYAASIESDFPSTVYEAMGGGTDNEDPHMAFMANYLGAVNDYFGTNRDVMIEGAKIPVFAPGTHLKIQSPGADGPMGDQFEQSLLRHIAAALDVSYEQLSKDFSKANYSSTRASLSETRRAMKSKKKMVADRIANFIYRLWFEEAMNKGEIEAMKRRNMPSFYEGLNSEAYLEAEWIGAEEPSIDPLKETQADVLALKNGLSTREMVIARRHGADWRRIQKQIKREYELDKAMNLPSVYEGDSQDLVNSISGTEREGNEDGN